VSLTRDIQSIRGEERRYPMGAEPRGTAGTSFRVWCPQSRQVCVVLEQTGKEILLEDEGNGYFSGFAEFAKAGMRYRFRLDSGCYPDPASRFQPEGPHGPSEIIDPASFSWTDVKWHGVPREGQIIYELHVGTFTPEGTWKAAAAQLNELADLGITVIEVMPVAEFTGQRGWGYDGVDFFAPTRCYGRPEDFRNFVNEAHGNGLGVILDVVYNHFGPDGNYLGAFSKNYLSSAHTSEWGDALNYDGEESAEVRRFILTNAAYWIEEFHLDGLRLDAIDQIFDDSQEHIVAEIAKTVRRAGGARDTLIVGENESQNSGLVRASSKGGLGLDALWNDDFHHAAIVAMTGRNEAYYTDYHGSPQEFISASKWGFLYQGQYYVWQKNRRGSPSLDLDSSCFVTFIQNHDQIANSLWGKRIHVLTGSALLRAMTAFLLLSPGTPMLFQGQEFASSAPFLYFADHEPGLANAVAMGRMQFLSQFPSIASPSASAVLANPNEEETFLRCKLDFTERQKNREIYRLHRDLIHLRKETPLFWRDAKHHCDGAVLGEHAFLLRFFGEEQDDRLLIINLGRNFSVSNASEPLMAPPSNHRWHLQWSSEDPNYGGQGTPSLNTQEIWHIPAQTTALLIPQPRES